MNVYVTLTCFCRVVRCPCIMRKNCEGPLILLITLQEEMKLCFEGPTSAVFCVGINEEFVPMRNCVFEVLVRDLSTVCVSHIKSD